MGGFYPSSPGHNNRAVTLLDALSTTRHGWCFFPALVPQPGPLWPGPLEPSEAIPSPSGRAERRSIVLSTLRLISSANLVRVWRGVDAALSLPNKPHNTPWERAYRGTWQVTRQPSNGQRWGWMAMTSSTRPSAPGCARRSPSCLIYPALFSIIVAAAPIPMDSTPFQLEAIALTAWALVCVAWQILRIDPLAVKRIYFFSVRLEQVKDPCWSLNGGEHSHRSIRPFCGFRGLRGGSLPRFASPAVWLGPSPNLRGVALVLDDNRGCGVEKSGAAWRGGSWLDFPKIWSSASDRYHAPPLASALNDWTTFLLVSYLRRRPRYLRGTVCQAIRIPFALSRLNTLGKEEWIFLKIYKERVFLIPVSMTFGGWIRERVTFFPRRRCGAHCQWIYHETSCGNLIPCAVTHAATCSPPSGVTLRPPKYR